MAKPDKNRVPGETRAYATAPGQHPSAAWPCVVSVCLWGDLSKRLDCRYSKSNSPLVAMTLDVTRTSGGLPAPEETDLLSASFPDIKSGLLSARRIQWAIEGLTEYEPLKGAGASILVDYIDGPPRSAGPLNREWAQNLDRQRANPGQIFLSQRVCETVEGLPSMSLEVPNTTGLRSWTWKTDQPTASFAADEQAVLGMIHAAGRNDPVVLTSPRLIPAPSSSTSIPDLRPIQTSSLGRADTASFEAPSPPATKSMRLPIMIGSAAALVVGVGLVFFFNHKPSTPGALPAQSSTPAQSAGPSSTPPVPAAHPGQPETHRKAPSLLDRLVPKKPAVEEPKTATPPVEARCDLTDEDIQRSLARADRYMHDGDLSNAKAAYLHVLDCPASRAKAQDGLSRIQRMAAQRGSPNP